MHKSPLNLDFYFVKKVLFELKEGFDSDFNRDQTEVEPPKLNINVESGKNDEVANHWRFELSIEADEKSTGDNFPYVFSISLVGFFQVDENFPAENADMLATINAPSVLYSAAREVLANITGRSPYPAILLPSISFVPEPEPEPKQKKSKSKTKKTVKKTKSKK